VTDEELLDVIEKAAKAKEIVPQGAQAILAYLREQF
jgi:hypothetical protein